jgi:predicted phosphohydrolase
LKIQVLSDLHLEFIKKPYSFIKTLIPSQPVDITIIAGDLIPMWLVKEKYKDLSKRLTDALGRILYVPGNHDYYHSSLNETNDILASMESSLFTTLNNKTITISDHTFIGSTLWFGKDPYANQYRYQLNDFHCIQGFDQWVYKRNQESLAYIQTSLVPQAVVISHHIPHPLCIAPQYQSSPLNGFFVCDCSDIIKNQQPPIWVFGHTHTSCDMTIHKTRLIANPHGYLHNGSENQTFNKDLTIIL